MSRCPRTRISRPAGLLLALAALAPLLPPSPLSSPSAAWAADATPSPVTDLAVLSHPLAGHELGLMRLRRITLRWREPAGATARSVAIESAPLPATGGCAAAGPLVRTELELAASARRASWRPSAYLTCHRLSVSLTPPGASPLTVAGGWIRTGRDPRVTGSDPSAPEMAWTGGDAESLFVAAPGGTARTLSWSVSSADPSASIVGRRLRTYAYRIPAGRPLALDSCAPAASPLYRPAGRLRSLAADSVSITYRPGRICRFQRLTLTDSYGRRRVIDSGRVLAVGAAAASASPSGGASAGPSGSVSASPSGGAPSSTPSRAPSPSPSGSVAPTPSRSPSSGPSATPYTNGPLTLAMVDDKNGDGGPNWADTITWNVSTSASPYPYVDLLCSRNGGTVMTASAGYYDGYSWSQNMILRSGVWTGGAADCTATLYYTDGRRAYTLATYSFTAGG